MSTTTDQISPEALQRAKDFLTASEETASRSGFLSREKKKALAELRKKNTAKALAERKERELRAKHKYDAVPVFPWDELARNGNKALIASIKHAEHGYIPANDIRNGHRVKEYILEFSDLELNNTCDACREILNGPNCTWDEELYYEFLIEIIEHYFCNRDYWNK